MKLKVLVFGLMITTATAWSSDLATMFAIDLGSSGVHLGGFKVNLACQTIEEEIFNKKERVLLQAGIQNGKLSEDSKSKAVIAIKKLLSEAKIDPEHTKVIGFATAWARAANNSDELINIISSEAKVTINIIDQQMEGKIGFNGTLATLRSFLLNKQSFLYQTEEGQKVHQKIAKDNHLMPQTVVSWDIGGGSMQFATQDAHQNIRVLGSTDSSTLFANSVISSIKGQKEMISSSTPNPLTEEQMHAAINLAMQRAASFIDRSFRNSVVFGIGLMHKGTRLETNRLVGCNSEHYYTRSDLEKATQLLIGKDDRGIAEALGFKESEARNRFTSRLLVLGFMKQLDIEVIHTIDVANMAGIFFTESL